MVNGAWAIPRLRSGCDNLTCTSTGRLCMPCRVGLRSSNDGTHLVAAMTEHKRGVSMYRLDYWKLSMHCKTIRTPCGPLGSRAANTVIEPRSDSPAVFRFFPTKTRQSDSPDSPTVTRSLPVRLSLTVRQPRQPPDSSLHQAPTDPTVS